MEYGLQMELPSNILGTIVRPCLQIVPLSSNGVIIGARMVSVTGGMTLQERQLRFDKITMISKDAFQLDSKVAFAKGGRWWCSSSFILQQIWRPFDRSINSISLR